MAIKLDDYKNLKKEIDMLNREIIEYENEEKVEDVVKGSTINFPYTQTSIKVEGHKSLTLAQQQTKNLLIKQRVSCERKVAEIVNTINRVPDSKTRMILFYRYIKGMGWTEIAATLNVQSSDTIRMTAKRALKEIN